MELHPGLVPPTLDLDRVKRVAELAEQAGSLFEQGADAAEPIAELNEISAREYSAEECAILPSYTSYESFARSALMPDAPHIPELKRADLVVLVEHLLDSDDESKQQFWLSALERNTPHSAVRDVVFGSDCDANEIVSRLLAAAPIVLCHSG